MIPIRVYLVAHPFAYLHTGTPICLSTHLKICFLSLYAHPVVSNCAHNAAFWSGQQTRQTPVSLCLVNRTKTPHFGHSSTLQGVHIMTKNTFLG
ncbi:hypothetical protein Hanom_Chr02g00101331 [Helianthus anomalus]